MSNPAKILIVEDNPADVRLIIEALRQKGIAADIKHLETAHSAIDFISGMHPDSPEIPQAILLDYNLPGGTAKDVLVAIRGNPALSGVPKAVLTCSVAPKDREHALSTGANLFVYKPADLDEFLENVGDAVNQLLAPSAA